jgi:hypothetical protein
VDLGYIRQYFDNRKAWDEWPWRVDRLGYDGLKIEQRPYRLEDVLAAHYRRKEFSEYFLRLMECSDDKIYDEEWRTFMLGIHCILYYFQLSLPWTLTLLLAAVYSLCIILSFLDLLCCCEFILY